MPDRKQHSTPTAASASGSQIAASPLARYALAGTAAFAFLCVLARAAIQSITIDEADSYLDFAGTPAPSHWLAACPLDAAPQALYRRCALCSLCVGLSFSANFSFALADASVLLLCALWLARRAAVPTTAYPRLSAASAWPALAVALLLTESALAKWTRSNFIFGAASLLETVRSVIDASVYRPNRYLLSPAIYKVFVFCGPWILPALGIACALRLATLALHPPKSGSAEPRLAVQLAWVAAAAALLSLGLHELLYRFFRVYLPLERTALFLAPLLALFAAALAAIPAVSRPGHAARRLLLASITATSIYFLGCLRLTYFEKWDFDAETKHIYAVLTAYNHACGLTDVCSNWRYVSALKFYRAAAGTPTPGGFTVGPPVDANYEPGKQMYVIFRPFGQPFIDRQHLTVVYEDAPSGVAIAIPPGMLTKPSEPRP